MLRPADLTSRTDFKVGPLAVSPARRVLSGPQGSVSLEPRVMQIFLLLVDAGGGVVTRDEIFDRCWGTAMVGGDNINRAIAAIRRAVAETAPGSLEIETIPRTGYRVLVPPPDAGAMSESLSGVAAEPAPMKAATNRRNLLFAASTVAVAVAGGGLLLWKSHGRTDPRFDALIERGEEALRLDDARSADHFRQAAAIDPRNARAWGLLAYALARGETSAPVAGAAAREAERAARAALEIDGREPNALLAMVILQSSMLDWIAREDQYRQILAIDPRNTAAMRNLSQMLHSVGRCRESFAMGERAIAIEPLAPGLQHRRALRLWVLGRNADAERVISRAMDLWPSHLLVRMARLMIYAFTGRAHAALAMVEDEQTSPRLLSPAAASVWRASLEALETRTAIAIAAARTANVEGAKDSPAVAAWAILTLSTLGELDAAFDVANGFLLGRGQIIVHSRESDGRSAARERGWRNTYGLFTPPTKAMGLDSRFAPLAEGLGITDYWRRRGIGPDDFLFRA
ncbi:MAG TPA: winged helix-turn-helix domain-containing protein [Sphingomicrobium sp.]|nr:winged helix-turn-helix domain-containing protein [Sphingomicrobium sp.]